MKTGMNKLENVRNACNRIRETIEKHKPKVIVLPECFNAPYGTKYFNDYAESIPDGDTCKSLSDIAKELKVFLVGGSIPERDNNDNKLYNTCTIWNPSGDLIAKYRKVNELPVAPSILLKMKPVAPSILFNAGYYISDTFV